MKKLDSIAFSQCCLNIGAGYDLQPLMRLAHMTDTFLYSNVFLPKAAVLYWYNTRFSNHSDFEVLHFEHAEDHGPIRFFEACEQHKAYYVKPRYPFNDPDFLRDYNQAFKASSMEPRWLLFWEVLYKPLNKTLRLYYYNGEGLATYHYFDPFGLNPPRILVTIQTGVLEYPETLLDRFFETSERPLMWVRGFQSTIGTYSYFERKFEILANSGCFNTLAMSFNGHWTAGNYHNDDRGYDYTSSKRFCKGFITSEESKRFKNTTYKSPNPKKVFIQKGKLEEKKLSNKDLVVMPSTAKVNLPEGVPYIYWEDLKGINRKGMQNVAYGAQQLVAALDMHLHNNAYAKDLTLHILPACVESQGKLHLEAMADLDWQSVHYATGILDFFDAIESEATETGYFSLEEPEADPISAPS